MCRRQNKELLIITNGLQNNCPCATYVVTSTVFCSLVISTLTSSMAPKRLASWICFLGRLQQNIYRERGGEWDSSRHWIYTQKLSLMNACLVCSDWSPIMAITNYIISQVKSWLRDRNCGMFYIVSFTTSPNLSKGRTFVSITFIPHVIIFADVKLPFL